MKNEGNENKKENGKINNFIKGVKAKAKTFVGTHMWVKDVFLLTAGAVIGQGTKLAVDVMKEVFEQAKDPNNNTVDVPGGTITFEETE